MADGNGTKYRHFILSGTSETQAYRSPLRGEDPSIKPQNRLRHGSELRHQIDTLRSKADATRQAQQDAGVEEGIPVEFVSFPDIKRAFENLAREHRGIELLNIRRENNLTYATVFVPDGKLDHFEHLIHNYLIEKRDKNGKVIDNRKLIDTIREIRGGKPAGTLDRRCRDVSHH